MIKIHLEDNGQDLLWLLVDETGIVVDAGPFQTGIWKGALIPVWDEAIMWVGMPCPIFFSSFTEICYLKHKIEKIELI